MNSVTFYSILLFIIVSIFIPSIYNYAYSSFIGRIVIIALIIYFSYQNVFLGLIFITIVITYSYPLYEGFTSTGKNDFYVAKASIVTNNTKPNNVNSEDDVYNYFNTFYCADPNKVNRWNNIVNNPNQYNSDEVTLATYHLSKANQVCNSDNTQYNTNYTDIVNSRNPPGIVSLFNSVVNAFSSTLGSSNNSSIDACSYNGAGYVYNTPDCLYENKNNFICNDINTGSSVYQAAQNISNSFTSPGTSQQDGQWVLNTQSWVCS